MSGANQRTLFQTWGASLPQKVPPKNVKRVPRRHKGDTDEDKRQNDGPVPPRQSLWCEIGQRCDLGAAAREEEKEDDDLMLVAVYEAEKSLESVVTTQDLPGFDISSGKVWIYPTNYPVREYQLKISEAALLRNTLVCLPTGLGKTFIASVVMYNFYRWYPSGKIVFMAPTKPLVAQQIEACYKVMGIPQEHMVELTGSTAAQRRQDLWKSKRIFFLTPQVMVNDLSRNTCPAPQVKCVVIDEAHKASGNHAYCQVIRELSNQAQQFRVLALSATPGGDMKSVQQVISNLLISHIELRSEESPDIQAHSHQRSLEKVVVPLGETLSQYQNRYIQVLERFTSRLTQMRVLCHRDLRSLTKYQLILSRQQFRSNPPQQITGAQNGALEGDFALCISLYHGYELLMQMGLRSLFLFLQGIMSDAKETARARNELQRNMDFMGLYREMEAMFTRPNTGPEDPFFYSHPKLETLDEVVLHHFRTFSEGLGNEDVAQGVSTRVMIFSSFRESVQEIATMLNRHQPLIRVMTFMGQASAKKGVRGFTQKEQLQVVRQFREGGFNTLVSTCVGEEGLDIGEVNLIVCFDAQKSPIRLVQRMGRTGRHKQGRIVVILAEGREERTYNQSQSNRRSVNKSILGNKHSFHMFPHNPRMLPEGVTPVLHKMHITCGQFEPSDTGRGFNRVRKSLPKGQESFLHNQIRNPKGTMKDDGFLTPEELSIWSSSMKLTEAEAHPTLPVSSFLSLPTDDTNQERFVENPQMELSLWEWRHWQNRLLPTHQVDHSDRCRHFVSVMDLTDRMRHEEGHCSYEADLMPHLHKEDVVCIKTERQLGRPDKRERETKLCSKSFRKMSHQYYSLGVLGEQTVETGLMKVNNLSEADINDKYKPNERPGQNETCPFLDNPVVDMDIDHIPHNSEEENNAVEPLSHKEHVSKTLVVGNIKVPSINLKSNTGCDPHLQEQCLEFEDMFYLPKFSNSDKSVQSCRPSSSALMILENVKQLLSMSPPLKDDLDCLTHDPIHMHKTTPTLEKTPSSYPVDEGDQLPISFCLNGGEDDEELMESSFGMKIENCNSPNQDDNPQPPQRLSSKVVEEEKCDGMSSPTWDEVFEYGGDLQTVMEEDPQTHQSLEQGGTKGQNLCANLDESVDLFGDDEAFLQISLPGIHTPDRNVSDVSDIGFMKFKHNDLCTNITACQDVSAQHKTNKDASVASLGSHDQNTFNFSQDFFSVNFDLGYSPDSSEDEQEVIVEKKNATFSPPVSSEPGKDNMGDLSSVAPLKLNKPVTAPGNMSTPKSVVKEKVGLSTLMVKDNFSPIITENQRKVSEISFMQTSPRGLEFSSRNCNFKADLTKGGQESAFKSLLQSPSVNHQDSSHPDCVDSDSDDELVVHKRGHQGKPNPLASPESKLLSDVDSPVQVTRKRVAALNVSEESEESAISDDDFKSTTRFKSPTPCKHSNAPQPSKRAAGRAVAHQFLDEEAEISEEGEMVSSDEEDDEGQNVSLEGFVVDNTQLSQGLNDSEMHCFYLKSVRSPALANKFKMVYKPINNMDIFSQVPELDETYAEDSFVVHGSDVEELNSSEEEVEEAVEAIPEDSYVDGRRNYPTRRKAHLRVARTLNQQKEPCPADTRKIKRSRIKRVDDSSEEDVGEMKSANAERMPAPSMTLTEQKLPEFKPPQSVLSFKLGSVPSNVLKPSLNAQEERDQQRLKNQALLSEELDFHKTPSNPVPNTRSQTNCPDLSIQQGSTALQTSLKPSSPAGHLSVLVDSRCIASGPEVISALRLRQGVVAHVCSLDGCDFIVSNRMAVEWQTQSDIGSTHNRKRLQDRMQSLQSLFERVCLILEADRTRPGETSRPFQRTRYYDNTVSCLVRAGVRLLVSRGPEDTAALLAELARVEQRKGQAIGVPLEVKGQRAQALQFYLTLPCVSFITALNMCHNFRSVAQVINSSLDSLQAGACVSRSRAEEIYRCLRYSCDSSLMSTSAPKRTVP
ncbi:Fanconi anemia group M protein isoform X2 [Denticeps clupeoides]|uniref:Fanconi anemia group M protein isoform X2 n=1 Tax=Denticeps clupeoides TaxID=299321 RepID=UPI0010A36422|nr:Fanconi anemia group M protein isoform X2 [Denticeps clupeoides]